MMGSGGGFSVDDGGMDEYDVADERQHLFEYINPDNMTYEEILALQERIGFVSKGLTRERVNEFPKMKKKDLKKFLRGATSHDEQMNNSLSQLEVEIRDPLEESKHSH